MRVALAAAVFLVVAAPAAADSGGTSAPSGGPAGGAVYNPHPPHTKRPFVLKTFSVGTGRFYDLGTPARVTWRIDSRAKSVHPKLEVRRAGARLRLIDLGRHSTGRRQTYLLTGAEGGAFPEGALQLRLIAGRLKRGAHVSSVSRLAFYRHRFPLVGNFSFGGPDARFGAQRNGHLHQGQDIVAPLGTPIVAPRGGIVTNVDYQASTAGYYVVVAVSGENRSYAFMHLRAGTTRVVVGQIIRTGARIGDVGETGDATGPHLHFEMWDGAWQVGRPVDPLPSLRRWDAIS
jgi:murein DD-endopeptidase MepM/ murein hydrolase activator NlpD